MSKNIVFFYPSMIVGGAEYLFMRSALFLSKDKNLNVKYIDYKDGFVAKQLKDKNIEIINCNSLCKTKVPKDSIVICPLSSVFDVIFDLTGDFSILFWSIHPTGLSNAIESYLKFSKVDSNLIYKDIQLLIDKKSVTFMDGANLFYQKEKFQLLNVKEEFLPIFCLEREMNIGEKKRKTQNIHLGWLGRLCIEKVNPLINVLRHLKKYAEENQNDQFVFHIIGDGDKKDLIVKEIMPDNITIKYLGTLTGDVLYNYIYQKIDLVFGMGTSVLEVASLKKAVVLVDFSFKEMRLDNNFRWLYESNYYSVGDEYKESILYLHDFSEIITKIKNNDLGCIEELCYNYFIKNHTIESICSNLLIKCDNTLLKNSMLVHTEMRKFRFIKFLKRINRVRKKILK